MKLYKKNHSILLTAYLKCNDPAIELTVNKYSSALQTLAYCSKVETNNAPQDGCTIITVSDKCEVHLLLKGLIDPAKEIQKIEKKIEFLINTKTKLDQAMAIPEYTTKVPEDVQKTNTDKLTQTITELERLQVAMQALQLMK